MSTKHKIEEEWTRWEPIVGLANKYDVEFIFDGAKGLTIRLYQDSQFEKKVDIIFEHYADAYRHTNESFRIDVMHTLTQKYGREFYGEWTFFKVKKSEYLQWLSEESADYSDKFPFVHFCLMGTDSIIDIIARYEPVVRFVE